MPRRDPATAGKRTRRLPESTRMFLIETEAELLRPLVAFFGWERAFEMTLEHIMPPARKREKLTVRRGS